MIPKTKPVIMQGPVIVIRGKQVRIADHHDFFGCSGKGRQLRSGTFKLASGGLLSMIWPVSDTSNNRTTECGQQSLRRCS